MFVVRNNPGIDRRKSLEKPLDLSQDTDNSKGILSLCMGVYSLISLITFLGSGTLAGAVGIIFGMIAYKENKELGKPTGMPLAGLICSIVGIALSVILLISCVACTGFIGCMGIEGLIDSFF